MANHSKDVQEKEPSNGAISANQADAVDEKSSQLVVDVKNDILERYAPEEQTILKEQVDDPADSTFGYKRILQYADKWDRFLYVVGVITSIVTSLGVPLMTVVSGSLAESFTHFFVENDAKAFQHSVNHFCLYFIYIAIAVGVCSFFYVMTFTIAAERVSRRIRSVYLEAVLSQNIGYFDKFGPGEMTSRITSDTNKIQDGIGEKVGSVIFAVGTFVSGFVIAYIRAWKFSLILSCIFPALMMGMAAAVPFLSRFTTAQMAVNGEASSFAQEVFSNVRNAFAFGTQNVLSGMYRQTLEASRKMGLRKSIVFGFLFAWFFFVAYMAYALAFWEGTRLLVHGELTLSQLMCCFFSVIMASYSIAGINPKLEAFSSCAAASKQIFSTIDRASPINPLVDDGAELTIERGEISLHNIKFVYPARPEVVVLDNFSLNCPAGKITALVGASGSGKSTIIGLVERFYKPLAGQVFIDGQDLSTINPKSLRNHIAFVQQEPTLFSTTIFENIVYGIPPMRLETLNEEQIKELVYDAAKLANAYDFIMDLPEKFETNVGQKGFLLSGGQKQRIAIARAVISDPKILLLDEATSALDSKSEVIVQKALDKASVSRTTIVIAHRLSTIRNADNIVVMESGEIKEQGNHAELIAKNGIYYRLVKAQEIESEREDEQGFDSDSDDSVKSQKKDWTHASAVTLQNVGSTSLTNVPAGNISTETLNVSKMGFIACITYLLSFSQGNEYVCIFIGICASIVCGGAYPVTAVIFSHYLNLFTDLTKPFTHRANMYAVYYIILAVVQFVAYFFSGAMMGSVAEIIMYRIRVRLFHTILRQDIEFFDRDENNTGMLTASLSTQVSDLIGLIGQNLGTFFQIATNVISVSILGLATGWKLALVTLATSPVMILSGYYRIHSLDKVQKILDEAYNTSASFACEAISAIRTVASLTREGEVLQHYRETVSEPAHSSYVASAYSGLFFGASQASQFLINALTFWYGATLLKTHEYTVTQFYTIFIAVVVGIQQAGQFFGFAADITKATASSNAIKKLFTHYPKIDIWSDEGLKVETIKGSIEFQEVHFRYPTRRHVPVLQGLNLKILPGQYVAFVGASGCGKSTTIGLIERFYDCDAGCVLVDDVNVREYNINNFRSHIALVSQEPTLYQGTVRENILLGMEREVSDEELFRVCEDANIHEFIMTLPNGYETLCGQNGSAFSGGQKQRIAIARALIRQPRILLLDEATSALDSKSETVVQEALNKASKGRTTVAIAHRLSSIQQCDRIFYFEGGKIVEAGTHQELMRLKGKYFQLASEQGLGVN
ncbi:leptomycin efflux transporter Pmd1 [Schizosaccharomyces japonicus yFS275]|uniref:Leptomycin efflux transporter Pmd1 n=1 Tax=Schizosaccharomyces japonicus (strain yFS275 / FY16936) TaxID=402676 RepID=B6K415_SCHJY|nr:leptomycin efflux transporter Pmd1 [Schizosaccharomyces japonicus yFS275]EEB08222.1 leptomycin efflux transporter Pmd1 [Schizosaccharomyces japonicus yFS275]